MPSPEMYNPNTYAGLNDPELTPQQRYAKALDTMMRLAGVTNDDIEQAQLTNDESVRASAQLSETAVQAWRQTSGAVAISRELQLAG